MISLQLIDRLSHLVEQLRRFGVIGSRCFRGERAAFGGLWATDSLLGHGDFSEQRRECFANRTESLGRDFPISKNSLQSSGIRQPAMLSGLESAGL